MRNVCTSMCVPCVNLPGKANERKEEANMYILFSLGVERRGGVLGAWCVRLAVSTRGPSLGTISLGLVSFKA